MNARKIAVAVAAAGVMAIPAQTAVAKQGGHESHASKGRCAKVQSVGFSAAGSLSSFTADSVTLTVTRANRHARDYIASAGATFSLTGARLSFRGVTDADASGTVDLADVLPTDVVRVAGKVSRPKRGCPAADAVVTLRKVQVKRPDAATAEPADDGQ
jgi:hypothetical protein